MPFEPLVEHMWEVQRWLHSLGAWACSMQHLISEDAIVTDSDKQALAAPEGPLLPLLSHRSISMPTDSARERHACSQLDESMHFCHPEPRHITASRELSAYHAPRGCVTSPQLPPPATPDHMQTVRYSTCSILPYIDGIDRPSSLSHTLYFCGVRQSYPMSWRSARKMRCCMRGTPSARCGGLPTAMSCRCRRQQAAAEAAALPTRRSRWKTGCTRRSCGRTPSSSRRLMMWSARNGACGGGAPFLGRCSPSSFATAS